MGRRAVLAAATILSQAELAQFFTVAGLLVLLVRARPAGRTLAGIVVGAAIALGATLVLQRVSSQPGTSGSKPLVG